MPAWHIITCEYPPQVGGVSDYTKLIATELVAAGDEVHVWCPAVATNNGTSLSNPEVSNGVTVHRSFGSFSPKDLRRVSNELDQFPRPRRLLVQWVAQGYGYRSINLPFCWWIGRRAKRSRDRVELMIHEPFLPFREGSAKQDAAAALHRLMITILLQAASQVWVSIPNWEGQLKRYARGEKSFGWLPVPNNIPVVNDPEGVEALRARYSSDNRRLVGHFGAYDNYMKDLLLKLVPLLNGAGDLSILLLGKGSLELREALLSIHPEMVGAVHATGMIAPEDISRHVNACDVMLQPYQDGVSGRRTSVMTALAHGIPVVTTQGKATETCWRDSGAVELTPADDIAGLVAAVNRLLADQHQRNLRGELGRGLYREQFSLERTISTMREPSRVFKKADRAA